MKGKHFIYHCLLVAIIAFGLWGIARISAPAVETGVRQRALLSLMPALPGQLPDVAESAEVPSAGFAHAQGNSPVVIDNLSALAIEQPTTDLFWEQYMAGEVDFENFEGIGGAAAQRAVEAWSSVQGADNYPIQTIDATNGGNLQLGLGFDSIKYDDSQVGVPPDPDVMVGKDHVVVGVNVSFAIYNKHTGALEVGPMLYDTLWGENCANGTADNYLLFDPFSTYDESAERYILGITANYQGNNLPGNNGYFCLAVSNSDDPTAGWTLYSFDANPAGTAQFADYPHIATGQDAIYVTANMFDLTGGTIQMSAFAIDKTDMYAGDPAAYTRASLAGAFPIGALFLTLEPADLHGFSSGGWPTNPNEPMYFVASEVRAFCGAFCNDDLIRIYRFDDPFGASPAINEVATLTVDTYRKPVDQEQPGSADIQANDTRMLDATYWGGSIWATHQIGCNPGSGNVGCLRWYEIAVTPTSVTLVQQGTVASNGEYRSFPSLAVNRCGDALLGYTKMSATEFPSVYVMGREAGDPLGQMKEETLIKAGDIAYTAYDPAPHRWGDYTQAVIDPDGETLWYVGEYSGDQPVADPAREVYWATWVQSASWANCTVPTGVGLISAEMTPPTNNLLLLAITLLLGVTLFAIHRSPFTIHHS